MTNRNVSKRFKPKRTELMTTVRQRKTRYYGHLRRHQSIQKQIMEGKIEGKRGRGRRRVSWLENVSSYMKCPINQCAEMALDRKRWPTITSYAVHSMEHR